MYDAIYPEIDAITESMESSIMSEFGCNTSVESSETDQVRSFKDESDEQFLRQVLARTLRYARKRNYVGYDYFDGMSSAVLQSLPFENKWVNIAFQEGIKRAPINIRPYLLVEQRRNFKGIALFCLANTKMYEATGESEYYEQAVELGDWLIQNQNDEYSGFCGGHRHAMQQLRERRSAETPNIIPTSYGVKALLALDAMVKNSTGNDYAKIAYTATTFVFEELDYTEFESGARIKYHPGFDGTFYTLNGGAIGARLLIDLYEQFQDEQLRKRATKLLDYLQKKQTSAGGWMYRDPPSASHLSMDNHHNGFIIESYQEYMRKIEPRYTNTLAKSLRFYRRTLFTPDGAPNWDENHTYPRDIHAAAQGIIVFSIAGEFEFARQIIDWTLANLYAGNGQFYYQKRRFYTKTFTLMRWCQAWMAYALAIYLSELNTEKKALEVRGC